MRRVNTFCFDRRQAPSAGMTVSTTVNSCGSKAIASAMPASKAASQSPRIQPKAAIRKRLAATAISANDFTKLAVCFFSGEGSLVKLSSAMPMRPISLRAPVAVTRALAWPLTSRVPEYKRESAAPGETGSNSLSHFAPASFGIGLGCWLATRLSTGTGSPVKSDSSTCASPPLISNASAAMRSPSARIRMSPHTTSLPAMRVGCPSRSTNARGLVRSRRHSMARSVLPSWYSVRASTTSTRPNKIRPSCKSPKTR